MIIRNHLIFLDSLGLIRQDRIRMIDIGSHNILQRLRQRIIDIRLITIIKLSRLINVITVLRVVSIMYQIKIVSIIR